MTYQIDKNIPVPARTEGIGLVATIRKMEVGDSIFIAADAEKYAPKYRSVNGAVQCVRMTEKEKKFTTRKVDGGVRTWRIA